MYLVQINPTTLLVTNVIPAAESPPGRLDNSYVLSDTAPNLGEPYNSDTGVFGGPPMRRRWITNLAFDNRFTKEERVNIEMAALVDPAMSTEQKRQAVSLQVDLGRAKKASYTDLDRADTQAGVQQFEAYGLIGVGRAAEILADPIAAHEYFPDA